MYTFRFTIKNLFGFVVLFLLQQVSYAQIVIGTPNLGFSQACASEDFNTYYTSFVFSPENGIDSQNQFIIELSDPEGDFTEAQQIYISNPGEITASPSTLEFSLPEETAGENYRIRIKSTSPAATSSGSQSFAAYYKLQDSPFTINNLVSTAAFCAGGNYLLSIDNPGAGDNDSPLNYPSLTFNWFKETGPTTSIFVAQGSTLTVTEEGTYFVETNYGTCTSNSFSNRVTVYEVFGGQANAEISSSMGNPFCPAQGPTTLSTFAGESYQWFKDDEIIPDATEQSYQTDEPGLYAVQVDLGDCSASGFFELESELFDGSLNIESTNFLEEGETLWVVVTTNAISPQYQWYFNGLEINGETYDNYTVTEPGNYSVIVTETSGCQGSREFEFTVIEPFPDVDKIPNVVSPNGDNINDTWVLPTKYVSGTNTEVMIMTNNGKVVLRTNDYMNNWPQDNNYSFRMNEVFFYVITTTNNETRKGVITVLK